MKKSLLFLGGILVGLLALGAWRFFSYHSDSVHYHSNFAVYVNGQREPFGADTYYEESSGCSADELNQPAGRAHMHDHENDIVHVEDSAVTWGQFFQNLGWDIGPSYLQTRDKLLLANATHALTYLLNGQPVKNPASLVIKSLDKLLVSYGTTDKAKLKTQYSSISDSAREENTKRDPASCSGPAPTDWQTRLKYIWQ